MSQNIQSPCVRHTLPKGQLVVRADGHTKSYHPQLLILTFWNSVESQNCTTQPMKDYNSNSKIQAQFNQLGIDELKALVQRQAPNISTTFTIGDFGCSHGGNSMTIINAILDSIQATRKDTTPLSVQVYHNDLPSNDFEEVFKCLHDPNLTYQYHSLLKVNPDNQILTMISAKSFYSQCLPSNHLDIGVAFNCAHWLQDIPIPLYRPLTFASSKITAQEKHQLQEESHRELVAFLQSRSIELRDGGHMMFSVLSQYEGLKDFDDIWQQHIEENNIDIMLLDAATIPLFPRIREDIERAIQEVPTLNLVKCTPNSHPCLFGHGDYGIAQMKAFTWPQIQAGLAKRQVFSNETQLEEFIEEYFRKIQRFYENREEQMLTLLFSTVEKVSNA
ncbi:hypothetical protein K7432_014824 [Basidiobolus ranarum]|uniref:Uncharacterized protein n=1 Tax=Basidiobolus ranarum TaxID=34480 RepID=A0ABR2WGZ2_9FUNG